jgi:hypothetical protein
MYSILVGSLKLLCLHVLVVGRRGGDKTLSILLSHMKSLYCAEIYLTVFFIWWVACCITYLNCNQLFTVYCFFFIREITVLYTQFNKFNNYSYSFDSKKILSQKLKFWKSIAAEAISFDNKDVVFGEKSFWGISSCTLIVTVDISIIQAAHCTQVLLYIMFFFNSEKSRDQTLCTDKDTVQYSDWRFRCWDTF